MTKLQHHLGINLLILVAYTIFSKLICHGPQGTFGYLILMLMFVGAQTLLNLIASIHKFWRKEFEEGKILLLCAGVILTVGFSACWGWAQ